MDSKRLDKLKLRETDRVARIIANKSFQKRVAELRQSEFSKDLDKELKKLTSDFCPNNRWLSGVQAYVLTDNIAYFKPDLSGTRIKLRFNPDGKRVGVDLELDPETTSEDLDAIWPYAKNVLRTIKSVPIKSQPYSFLDRDAEIIKLKFEDNMSNSAIAQHMADKHYVITPEYISTIIKRYKERIDTNPTE
jgi:hypothetical protein